MNTTFRIGTVIASGLRVWARNVIPFLLISVVIYAPLWIWGLLCTEAWTEHAPSLRTFQVWSAMLSRFLGAVATCALAYRVVTQLQGQRASLGASLARCVQRFFPMFETLVVLTLCVFGVSGVFGLLRPVIAGWVPTALWAVAVTWLTSVLYVVAPVIVIERPAGIRALGRSRALTRRHRIALVVAQVVPFVLGVGIQYALQLTVWPSFSQFMYVYLVRTVLVGSLAAVLPSIAYYYLRAAKEGTSAPELATVFD